jgi:hypothetical protein
MDPVDRDPDPHPEHWKKSFLLVQALFWYLLPLQVALNLNWSIVADMLLYVVVPTCRSTAEAVQILFSHAFGDAGSPYLIGLVSKFDLMHRSVPLCTLQFAVDF